jgi:phage shock protein A
MTLFRRINDILTANLHDLVDRFEDPEKMLRQVVREMDNAVAAATSAAARAIATQKLLLHEIDSQRASAERWRRKAARAADSSDDAEALRALARRRQTERLADSLEKQRDAAQATVSRLRRRIEVMRLKRAEADRLLIELAARQCLAQADRRLAALAPRGVTGDFCYRIDRWRRRVSRAEAEAEALDELVDGAAAIDDDEEFAAIESELIELKRRTP